MSLERRDQPVASLTVTEAPGLAAGATGMTNGPMAKRVTRRRVQTRERLMAAGLEVFAERGLGATIEEICDRAGYTRGAFYSNFRTVEELFFSLYEQRANLMLERGRAAISNVLKEAGKAGRAGDIVEAAVKDFLSTAMSPHDRSWWLVTTEYALHAARNPEAAQRLAVLRKRSYDELDRFVVSALERAGLCASVSPHKLSRVLAAVHAGALAQSYEEPDALTYEELLRLAIPSVLRGLSRKAGPG
jgi:AcrR family transcriptional regulator